MPETLAQLVARINANAYIPPLPQGERIMAKPIKLSKGKEFTFRSAGGTTSKYPWDTWFNGDLLMLEKGVDADYNVETDAMAPKIKTAARRRYKVVQVSRLDADGQKLVDSIIIKARDMTPDERASEDLKRAEEKAARTEVDDDETVAPTNG